MVWLGDVGLAAVIPIGRAVGVPRGTSRWRHHALPGHALDPGRRSDIRECRAIVPTRTAIFGIIRRVDARVVGALRVVGVALGAALVVRTDSIGVGVAAGTLHTS